MTSKINYLKKEDFDRQGIFNQFRSECRLKDLVFRKGDTFENQEIKQVLDTCKKYKQLGTDTLIVRSNSDLTIWIEQKSQSKANGDRPNSQTANISPTTSSTPQTSLPTKTVTKRYRGQVYEETVVDWAAVAMQKQNKTPKNDKQRRKYRGNYID